MAISNQKKLPNETTVAEFSDQRESRQQVHWEYGTTVEVENT